jgi:hypothetical protein
MKLKPGWEWAAPLIEGAISLKTSVEYFTAFGRGSESSGGGGTSRMKGSGAYSELVVCLGEMGQ